MDGRDDPAALLPLELHPSTDNISTKQIYNKRLMQQLLKGTQANLRNNKTPKYEGQK